MGFRHIELKDMAGRNPELSGSMQKRLINLDLVDVRDAREAKRDEGILEVEIEHVNPQRDLKWREF